MSPVNNNDSINNKDSVLTQCQTLNRLLSPPPLPPPHPQKHGSDWKPEIRIPHNSEYVVLSGLDWDTEYEVHVVAENQQGKSDPGVLSFRTSTEPSTMPGTPPSHAHTPPFQLSPALTVPHS